MFDVTSEHTAEQELKRHAERLQRTLEGAVLAVSHIAEARDPYTAGHQRRVAELATAIAGRMGLTADETEGLRLAALIHDIGKIAVPAEILSKPGRLTETEFTLIKGHSEAGYAIISDIEFEQPVADIVLQHHERLDGSGYPQGLSGDAIGMEARVLAVADVYEAMVSHRPYRAALDVRARDGRAARRRRRALRPRRRGRLSDADRRTLRVQPGRLTIAPAVNASSPRPPSSGSRLLGTWMGRPRRQSDADETLAICERTTARDWVYWVYVPLAGPGVVPASVRGREARSRGRTLRQGRLPRRRLRGPGLGSVGGDQGATWTRLGVPPTCTGATGSTFFTTMSPSNATW